MDHAAELEHLRQLFLTAPESDTIRWVAIASSAFLVATVLYLVRRRILREEYTPIWMLTAFALLLLSIRSDLLHALTRALGAWTASSTLFFLGQFFLVLICLNYSVRLSRASVQIKNLAQEVALLRAAVEDPGVRRPAAPAGE